MSIVESLARAAVHRRDHGQHVGDNVVSSSCFEIIFIGCDCFCVCHDCGFDTPLIDKSFANVIKSAHACPQC